MALVDEIRKAQRARGPAMVLAIGTAVPVNCFYQADYPDYFFRVTKTENLTELKAKFKRICMHTYIYICEHFFAFDINQDHLCCVLFLCNFSNRSKINDQQTLHAPHGRNDQRKP
jgi:hypothetical protein